MRIAIVGPMGSGKTTVANILCEEHGFRRESLATPVKAIADGMAERDGTTRMMFLARWARALLPDPIYADINPHAAGRHTSHQLLVSAWLTAYQRSKNRRELYQRVGTDCGRAIKPEIWIDWFARHLHEGNVVIDDVRFLNEAGALHALGFHLVRMEVPEETRGMRLLDRDGGIDETRMAHASETEQNDIQCDTLIENVGDLENLRHQVGALVGRLRVGLAA